MMFIRPIHPDEVERFAALTPFPEHAPVVQAYLEQMLAQGATRIDWCFILEDTRGPVGRVACWTLPKVATPLDIVLLDLPWEGEFLAFGSQLLTHTIETMRGLGATDIGTVVDSPPQWPQWHSFPEQRHALLTHLGFGIARDTLRFAWDAERSCPEPSAQLHFRTLEEVGEEAFLDALEQVSAGSLDQRTQAQRASLGAAEEARETFKDLKSMDFDPAWWQLAYTPAGELVGLVMPTRNPTAATIGYIGVVPEQRGRGYIHDLLTRGTTTLLAAGNATIRTDTDIANLPMAAAFRQAGYTQFATRREYQLK